MKHSVVCLIVSILSRSVAPSAVSALGTNSHLQLANSAPVEIAVNLQRGHSVPESLFTVFFEEVPKLQLLRSLCRK